MATVNLLRAVNGSVPVTAYHDAAVFHSALGNRIFKGVYQDMKATMSGNTITILSGMCLFGGRQVEIPAGTSVTLDISEIAGRTDIFVMLKITVTSDGEGESAEVYASTANETTSTTPIDGVGVHKIMFAGWHKIGGGYVSWTPTMRTIEAGHAKKSYALLETGSIAGMPVRSIFLPDFSGAKYAKNADVASEARGFVGGSKNRVNANLYMPNRGVTLAGFVILVSQASLSVAANASTTLSIPSTITPGMVFLDVIYGVNGGRSHSWTYAQKLESSEPKFTYAGLEWTFNFTTHTVVVRNTSTSSAVNLTKPFIAAMVGAGSN